VKHGWPDGLQVGSKATRSPLLVIFAT